jgi:DNA-directed RNA polymerase subunit RPC12/RpoP
MLRLVESLATKVERAKSTTVQFVPLRARPIGYKCDWCGKIVNSKQKGWISFRAIDCSSGFEAPVAGDVCDCDECMISIQAKYTKND